MYASLPYAIRDDLVASHRLVWEQLGKPGCWWTGALRIAIAREVRQARVDRVHPAREQSPASGAPLPPAAVEAARRIAIEPHKLDRQWSRQMVADLGDAPYVELVAVASSVVAIDTFAEALGAGLEPLPEPVDGEPTRERPDGVGDDGAWVPMTVPWPAPNVARALSLVPQANAMFFSLVSTMYAGQDFMKLVWDDRPLSRPQVELVAARVSAVNECFY